MTGEELRAVIFDVDGTLVDSEQQGHRVAFNEAFAAFAVADRWDPATYRELLAVPGGFARLRTWFADPRSALSRFDDDVREAMADSVHRWKTSRFEVMARTGTIPARAGVHALLERLAAAQITVAVATTGSRAWVEPLLDRCFGAERFACVVTGDDVERRKPAPDGYHLAMRELAVPASGVVAVEDSGPGARAALAAGVACVVVANDETDLDAVAAADLVVSGFGAPGRPMTSLADPHGAVDGQELSLQTLRRVHAASTLRRRA